MSPKERIRKAGLHQWEVAEEVGVSEFVLCRWLRRPENLGQEKRERVEAAITALASRKQGVRA